ncbi:10244_t:CDS:2 [Funneliformis caledonium]|uniref:10244_t:CDS:1 n=1 Tax=Funneliformis caledonium TaxID=1117310 RepID=A0A9N8YK20_9GLOM|nr:10244_t:CDS:2 [Funneliformis caledonium]
MTYLAFGLSYIILSNSIEGLGNPQTSKRNLALVVIFYYFGFYLLNTERVQLKYLGWRRYFNVYNFFDLFSVILPFTSASIQIYYKLSAYFRYEIHSVVASYFDLNQENFIIFNAFTILVMWMEIILLLRYFEKTGAYIYIVMNILQSITSFLIFILLIVLGFGHTIILLVTILQNMLIAIMAGAYDQAKEISKHAALKYRAELIADYELFDKPFGNRKGDPRYIFYFGKTDYIEKWLEKSEKFRESYKNFLEEIEGANPWSYDDDDSDNLDHFQKFHHHSHSYTCSSSLPDDDSEILNSQKRIVPLCLYCPWNKTYLKSCV